MISKVVNLKKMKYKKREEKKTAMRLIHKAEFGGSVVEGKIWRSTHLKKDRKRRKANDMLNLMIKITHSW